MKSLKESLLDDIDVVSDKIDVKKDIKNWLKVNLGRGNSGCRISNNPNENGKYVVNANNNVLIFNGASSLTNGMFEWGKVKGSFICVVCKKITSLEGAPREVSENFICSGCSNLTSLEGAPAKVGKIFDCRNCGKQFSAQEVKNICEAESIFC